MNRLRFYFCLTSIFMMVVGCTSIPGNPGYISKSTSDFDGSNQILMKPAWVPYCPIKLGLQKNSKMDRDNVILTVVLKGAYIFSSDESLHFNIDGEIISFKSIDQLTDINTTSGWVGNGLYLPPSNWSSKNYLVDIGFIKKLIDAEKAVIKVDLKNESVEGVFSSDGLGTARGAFRGFYKELQTFGM